jgi:plasmid stability protein
MAQWLMRTTVDIPDGMYRQLKSRAAREGSSTRALILKGVKEVLKSERRKTGTPVVLPIVRSRRPGTVALDNAIIYDIAFP